MKQFFLTIIILAAAAGSLRAENNAPSDSAVLNDLLSQGIAGIIEQYRPLPGKIVRLSYDGGIRLSSRAKEAVEALLTAEGFSLADEEDSAGFRINIAVTDARVVLQKYGGGMSRSAMVNIHLWCADFSNRIIFASGRVETFSDSIPDNLVRSTNDCGRFSPDAARHMITKKHDILRLSALIVMSGLLVYLAFE